MYIAVKINPIASLLKFLILAVALGSIIEFQILFYFFGIIFHDIGYHHRNGARGFVTLVI